MNGELERLLVSIEANTAILRREMTAADKSVDGFVTRTDRSLKRAEDRFKAFEKGASSALSRVGAVMAGAFTVKANLDVLEKAGELRTYADAAGLTAERFQELRFAFAATGVSQEEFGRAMGTFARNMGELQANTGGFYEFLRQSLPTVEAQLRNARSQDEAFVILAEAVRRLDSDQARATLTQKAMGEQGFKTISVMKGGAAALAEASARAREHGILTNENAEAAEKLSRQYNEFKSVIETTWQRLIVGAVQAIKKTEELNATLNAPKGKSLTQVDEAIASVMDKIRALQDGTEKPLMETPLLRLMGLFGATGNQVDVLKAKLQELFAVRGDLMDKSTAEKAVIGPWQTTTDSGLKLKPKPDYTGADAIAGLARQRADAENEAFLSIRLGMEQELEQFRRLYDERKITEIEYNQARESITLATSARIEQEIKRETQAIAAQFAPFRSVIEQNLTQPLDDAFAGNLQSMSTYLSSLASGLAKAITQALILKPILDGIQNSLGGPGGATTILNALGLKGFGQSTDIGTNNSGSFAVGGQMAPGESYQLHKDEVVVPNTSATVFNPSDSRKMVAGAGGSVRGGDTYNIDARYSDAGVEQRIAAGLAAVERKRPNPAAVVSDTQRRFPTRRG